VHALAEKIYFAEAHEGESYKTFFGRLNGILGPEGSYPEDHGFSNPIRRLG